MKRLTDVNAVMQAPFGFNLVELKACVGPAPHVQTPYVFNTFIIPSGGSQASDWRGIDRLQASGPEQRGSPALILAHSILSQLLPLHPALFCAGPNASAIACSDNFLKLRLTERLPVPALSNSNQINAVVDYAQLSVPSIGHVDTISRVRTGSR